VAEGESQQEREGQKGREQVTVQRPCLQSGDGMSGATPMGCGLPRLWQPRREGIQAVGELL
jgi:hypothetical protein